MCNKIFPSSSSIPLREMVLETSVLSTFNHLTRLEARENFIIFSRRESLKSYMFNVVYEKPKSVYVQIWRPQYYLI
jgi:hypothetical protein